MRIWLSIALDVVFISLGSLKKRKPVSLSGLGYYPIKPTSYDAAAATSSWERAAWCGALTTWSYALAGSESEENHMV